MLTAIQAKEISDTTACRINERLDKINDLIRSCAESGIVEARFNEFASEKQMNLIEKILQSKGYSCSSWIRDKSYSSGFPGTMIINWGKPMETADSVPVNSIKGNY